MAHVIKIKYENTLRRCTFETEPHGDDLSYARLESRIRGLFKLPPQAQIHVTYTDKDDDVITMADDQDLVDALIMQSLNPLRLNVTIVDPKSAVAVIPDAFPVLRQQPVASTEAGEEPSHVRIKQSMKAAYEPLLKGVTASPRQLSELVETIVKTVTSQISSAEKGEKGSISPLAELFASQSSASVDTPKAGPTPVIRPFPAAAGSAEASHFSPVKREIIDVSESKNASRIFHAGVSCDECGMSPITGSRFKSTKRHDYDLCFNCFKAFGSASDYTRIDRPLYRPRHLHPQVSGRSMRCPAFNTNFHSGRPVSMWGPYGSRTESRCSLGQVHQINGGIYGGKLDARFVQDVTILDGTELSPGTRFTKIWRLRNSGTLPWAPQTKLVHVGGDEMGSVFTVTLELPEQGLAPEQEVEAAVDLIAPEKPGRYVSHWRLASPAGPKFGHRVWVLIQVISKEDGMSEEKESVDTDGEMSQEDEATETSPLLSAAASSASRDTFVKASHEAFVNQEGEFKYPSVDHSISFADQGLAHVLEMVTKVKEEHPAPAAAVEVKEEVLPENVVEEVVEEVFPENSQVEVVTVESSELGGGFSMVEMPLNTGGESNSARTSSTMRTAESEVRVVSVVMKTDHEVEEDLETELATPEVLLVKLEAMGFADRKLNMELLGRNKLDLRKTLDDLFAAAEWDPILEELEEMGFYDTEMNRRLMFKNNGSVKRVVKELVQMYKEPAGKGKEVIIV